MPAVMILKSSSNPVPDSPGRWLAGEIVAATEQDHIYGWLEFPQNFQGQFTVAQVNGIDVTTLPLYSTIRVTDSGTINNTGFGDPIDVVAGDAIALMYNDAWYGYGQKSAAANTVYHIRVNDKTVEEVSVYLEAYNKKLEYSSQQYDPSSTNRRFTSTNVRVSVSNKNGFTAQGITDAIAEWNTNHPLNTVEVVDTDNLTYFQCDGKMPAELFDEWKQNTQEFALLDYYARRRWYITPAGLTSLSNNAGVIKANAADIAPFLRDGLLD